MPMSRQAGLQPSSISSTIRFIQGYRYLDRCGEALVRLEKVLDSGWIPDQFVPTGGAMRNDELGMTARFSSESMTVGQTEFIDFEHFKDQTCRIYDTLRDTLEIRQINAPTLRGIFQKGFDEEETAEAEKYVRELALCVPTPEVLSLLEGSQSALQYTIVTEDDISWDDLSIHRRRRLNVSVVRQKRQPTFDDRLLKRVRLLSKGQQQAMSALSRLRKQHSEVSPVAAQFDVETSFETELSCERFRLPQFLEELWQWLEEVHKEIPRLGKGR